MRQHPRLVALGGHSWKDTWLEGLSVQVSITDEGMNQKEREGEEWREGREKHGQGT